MELYLDTFPDAVVTVTNDNRKLLTALPPLIGAVICFVFCGVLRMQQKKQKVGKDINMPILDDLSGQVKEGAMTFLRVEYKFLSVFVLLLAVVLIILYSVSPVTQNEDDQGIDGVLVGVVFVLGAAFSASAGYIGMLTATDGNVRTTVACANGSLNEGLRVAFAAGSIMGFSVVGLTLFGVSIAYLLCSVGNRTDAEAAQLMTGFGFGGSSIALFARVAGGIYTKAADVGADLVGKVEAGINEDDPHNPAVIADNVGDNVGDVAGMGADLFESYVGSIIAAATLGSASSAAQINYALFVCPFWLAASGVIASFIGFFFVSTKEEGSGKQSKLSALMWALEKGMYAAGTFFIAFAAVICFLLFNNDNGWKIFACVIIGLVAGMIIGKVTEYFTSFDFGPVKSITDRGKTGPATVIIQGMGVGQISCLPPTVVLVSAIVACNALASGYGVAIAAVGMLSTLGITLATDAYGPVADNAGGLAEMCPDCGPEVRNKTDALDALGNTTAATGKGFAIGSAVLTALSLVAAFRNQVATGELSFDISEPIVLSGVLFGSMLPNLFAALTMMSVGKAAAEIIEEVRRQFRELKNAHGKTLRDAIMWASENEGKPMPTEFQIKPDSNKCVEISTRSSVREMVAPGVYALLTPLTIGFLVGPKCLMGVLAGSIGCGAMIGIMMSNAGGAWDNAKKLAEKEGIKKTEQGKACVVGDTVGDPFKDTSGPALNILLKLIAMASVTIAPLLRGKADWEDWYFGLIPLALMLIATAVLMRQGTLTWKDPLGKTLPADQKTSA